MSKVVEYIWNVYVRSMEKYFELCEFTNNCLMKFVIKSKKGGCKWAFLCIYREEIEIEGEKMKKLG